MISSLNSIAFSKQCEWGFEIKFFWLNTNLIIVNIFFGFASHKWHWVKKNTLTLVSLLAVELFHGHVGLKLSNFMWVLKPEKSMLITCGDQLCKFDLGHLNLRSKVCMFGCLINIWYGILSISFFHCNSQISSSKVQKCYNLNGDNSFVLTSQS